jgi:hypothetical protein
MHFSSLFNDVFEIKDYKASNKRVINEWWIRKDLEESGRRIILRYYLGIRMEGLRKSTKNVSQDSRSPDRDLKPHKYEAQLLTTRQWRSVAYHVMLKKL